MDTGHKVWGFGFKIQGPGFMEVAALRNGKYNPCEVKQFLQWHCLIITILLDGKVCKSGEIRRLGPGRSHKDSLFPHPPTPPNWNWISDWQALRPEILLAETRLAVSTPPELHVFVCSCTFHSPPHPPHVRFNPRCPRDSQELQSCHVPSAMP